MIMIKQHQFTQRLSKEKLVLKINWLNLRKDTKLQKTNKTFKYLKLNLSLKN